MLKTRLDGRSEDNNSFELINENGDVLMILKLIDVSSATIEIGTKEGLYIQKPTGWSSKKK